MRISSYYFNIIKFDCICKLDFLPEMREKTRTDKQYQSSLYSDVCLHDLVHFLNQPPRQTFYRIKIIQNIIDRFKKAKKMKRLMNKCLKLKLSRNFSIQEDIDYLKCHTGARTKTLLQ